jgi:hypothetical protein
VKKSLYALAAGALLSGAAVAAPVQWTAALGGNDHWYEFIETPVTWQAAFTAANAATFMGMQGYLATLTSDGENRFAAATAAQSNLAWIGGSDDGAEGVWSWRNGPENGEVFWNNGAVPGVFSNFNAGEPNNCCNGESFLQVNFAFALGWNDHGGPGNASQVNGYLIEYPGLPTGIPEPSTLALLLAPALAGVAARRRKLQR